MELDVRICERARLARDPRFDGLFFIGVHSTGIFCRPICPAPAPKPKNIVYYPTAAAAAAAGLRPCRRCRPETAPGSPAWNGTSAIVSRALLMLRREACNDVGLAALADRLGVGSRHLRRLFQRHVGASPKALITTQRVLFAKKLLNETDLPISQIAFASGFGSIRRFNAAFQKLVQRTPSAFRRPQKGAHTGGDAMTRCRLTLPYRPPFDWRRMLSFFQTRAIPGVEWVADDVYRRTVEFGTSRGTIAVTRAAAGDALLLETRLTGSQDLMTLVERVRRMFDLDANMGAIHAVLAADPTLAAAIERHPGLRLPGAWDPFETAVRAVVGQQVSVKGARTLIGRIVARTGEALAVHGIPHLTHLFPSPPALRSAALTAIGMPARRVATVAALARAVADGTVSLKVQSDLDTFVAALTRIPGIGDWTAHYVAMRALAEPDAFPAADLGILRALTRGAQRPTAKQARAMAERWRPWRAYAAIYLWHA
ncbi:MAG: AlkA N-terminal domain-containing protein [Desulfosarcinaceae bacterium]|nr:AlkA N-terminal domain-containing protein [Desulfosarcinaceae bacterium]